MYQRVGAIAFKKDLTNIVNLCNALGNPQNTFKSIHIAGTNGKGSTCHILSAIYQNNGYKVGLYTSPHLVDFRERIKLNGELCSKDFVIDFTSRIQPLIDEIKPSFFEITVAMAFEYFAQEQVDIAIIETGLGGRLDSTNILSPICTAITSIGLDHTDMLGETITEIAGEKAGIIKTEVPIVIGKMPQDALNVIKEIAMDKHAVIHATDNQENETDLLGEFQQINISTALKITEVNNDIFPITKDKTPDALNNVGSLSQFIGRMQICNDLPLVIVDVAHNSQGIAESISELNKRQLTVYFILGFVRDKNLSSVINLLPKDGIYSFVKPSITRGKHAEETKIEFNNSKRSGNSFASLTEAIEYNYNQIKGNHLEKEAMIYVGGSNFIVADFLHLKQENKLPF